MHITSGLSPASGEMLDAPSIHFYGECVEQSSTGCMSIDNAVPESSHTVEIEYESKEPDKEKCRKSALPKTLTDKNTEKTKSSIPPESMIEDQETDLTNLTWLQNITNIMSVPEFPMSPMSPNPQIKKEPQNTRLQKFNLTIAKCQKDFMENKEQYRNNSEMKPPYSYSTLICMAMRYNDDKMTLSAIYSWIRDNFKYYRNADPTWQNSIRHNLSLNKVFVKVARSKQERGKGGFWKLDLGLLDGNKRISNRPNKKKKVETKADTNNTEENIAVANIPQVGDTVVITEDMVTEINQAVNIHLPEFNMGVMQSLPDINLDCHIGANVIVEPVGPPSLMPEEDLSSLLLSPTDWDDLQLDMLDNYLDSCFK